MPRGLMGWDFWGGFAQGWFAGVAGRGCPVAASRPLLDALLLDALLLDADARLDTATQAL